MPDLKNIDEYIKALEHMLQFFRQLVDEENDATLPPVTPTEHLAELTDLRLLARSKDWPGAIDPTLISNDTEEDKIDRAEGVIVDFMKIDLQNKRFLDFGCGDGYVARQAAEHGASLAIGYDLSAPPDWHPKKPNLAFLVDNLTVEDFDVVLLYDALDHITDPVAALRKVKLAKKKDAKVFVRCHPWVSRHGTHLYRNMNKAYLHLVFSDSELRTLGLREKEYTVKLLDPIKSYKEWFSKAQLEIEQESTITQPVDSFFTTQPAVARRIKENWRTSEDMELAGGTKFPHDQMMIQFADFVLV